MTLLLVKAFYLLHLEMGWSNLAQRLFNTALEAAPCCNALFLFKGGVRRLYKLDALHIFLLLSVVSTQVFHS